MISVIIPYMPNKPYDGLISDCIESVNKQTAEKEIIISEQVHERYIYKNKLLNSAIGRSKGNIVFFCDADFLLEDPTLLERMEIKLKEKNLDVIYPMFHSARLDGLKIADGAAFATKTILMKHGPLNESLKGISHVTFPMLHWMMRNAKFHCSPEFIITHRSGTRNPLRRSGKTAKYTKPIFKETVKMLERRGLWPA